MQLIGRYSVTIVQATATSLIEEQGVVRGAVLSEQGGKKITRALAPLTFVVDGCFSKFRAQVGGPTPAASSSFVGLVLNMPVEQMLVPQHGHVVLADPSPILLYALTPREIRILVDVPHPLPSGEVLKQYMIDKVCPQLPASFRQPFLEAIARERLRSMPNNQMSGQQSSKPGAVLIGDSYNMRHPLTGGGMTVGLSDAFFVTDELRGVELSSQWDVAQALQRWRARRTPLAATINVLAMALYRVFTGCGGGMASCVSCVDSDLGCQIR